MIQWKEIGKNVETNITKAANEASGTGEVNINKQRKNKGRFIKKITDFARKKGTTEID